MRNLPVYTHPDNPFIRVMNAIRRTGIFAGKIEAQKEPKWFCSIIMVRHSPTLRIVSDEFELHFTKEGDPKMVEIHDAWPETVGA
jgi:hypothetical protein